MKKKLMKYVLMVVALCVAGVLFNCNSVSATCTTDSNTGDVTCTDSASATVHVSEACTMNATLNTPHIAEMTNGLYQTNIGSTTLNVVCNDASGFSIYAVGYTNDEFGNNRLLTSSIEQDAPIINTGTSSSGSNSTWSMKLTPVSNAYAPTLDNSFNDYHNVPTTYTRVAYKSSGTDAGTNPTGSSIEATYAAYISGTQPAGTYTGQVKYTLVHPMSELPVQPQTTESGKICYYANANDTEGTMGCQDISSSVTLLASNFSREGYGFAGWSTTFDYSDSTGFYGPQETITLNTADYSGTNKGLSLYAHWIKSTGNIQGWTGCNSLASGAVTALTDQRDNNTYAVAKLADGNCWMIENLRLENTAEHNSDGTLAQGYGTSATYGNFAGLADAESANFTESTTANSLYYSGTQEGTASINIVTSNSPGYRFPRYNNWNNQSASANRPQNPTTNGVINSTTNAGMYSYGNYYTWHAAIADLTYNGTNNQSTTGTSLCPSGWHLPKGGDKSNEANNELWSLVVDGINGGTKPANYDSLTYPNYTGTPEGSNASNKLRAYPNNFLYSGVFGASSAVYRGSVGLYWSSTAYSNYQSRSLSLFSSYVYPGTNYSNKSNGYSIRCTIGS